ncbi:unnamed protein product [Cyprideis torosa]|uniref:Uncharacterized protein n=1 Tax=Cyprideis torosa TaxID=163714 RepID=A0A7R8ZPS5_9CRUS|nr:unnamed protein product [Cyprideis torosa]CAG0899583.1 unnamed protein product [Cyprideis torosa]
MEGRFGKASRRHRIKEEVCRGVTKLIGAIVGSYEKACRLTLAGNGSNTPWPDELKNLQLEARKIKHVFDAWHIQKSLGKALGKVGIRGGQRELQMWSRHLTNHLLWSIRNCGGSYAKLLRIWFSCLRHVVNDHGACYHEELPEDEVRDTEWIEERNPAHTSLTRIVNETGFTSDLKQATELRFSSELEAFHSELNIYLSFGTPELRNDTACLESKRRRTMIGASRSAMKFFASHSVHDAARLSNALSPNYALKGGLTGFMEHLRGRFSCKSTSCRCGGKANQHFQSLWKQCLLVQVHNLSFIGELPPGPPENDFGVEKTFPPGGLLEGMIAEVR